MATLVIIPCGSAKVWTKHPDAGPTEARDVYTGSPFKVNRKYAERFGDEWLILSAKFGFLRPRDIVAGPYNVTFKDERTGPISVAKLRDQLRDHLDLTIYENVIALGGKEYREIIAKTFSTFGIEVRFPFAGMNLFEVLAATKRAVALGDPDG